MRFFLNLIFNFFNLFFQYIFLKGKKNSNENLFILLIHIFYHSSLIILIKFYLIMTLPTTKNINT